MAKYSFLNDYGDGCHPQILAALTRTNDARMTAYGEDVCSNDAKALIRQSLKKDSDIYFVGGGTQANLIMIGSALRPHEAVIAAASGHIATHETGAIEATGHKIISVATKDGKLTPEMVKAAFDENTMPPHMAKPRLVYISNATETGRIYKRSELIALSTLCRELGLWLMVDGARMAVALAAGINDVSLSDLASYTDMFWFGGTKAGTMFGEAIIINSPGLAADFRYHIKQRGALLAKGRFLGLQFQALFKEDLYKTTASHANGLAQKISNGLSSAGYDLADPTQTNQIFPILPNNVIERLETEFDFYRWQARANNMTTLRLVTSWSTDPAQVDRFLDALNSL